MRTLAAALALLASSPIAAYAQIPEDPEANLVEELVVNARLPGPAWWRISDADTTIYVLGTLASLPKGAAWDRSVLERRLDGAFALILPPVGRAGITDIPAMLRLRGKLKSDQPLDAAAPELAPRLAKGIMIAMDYQKTNRLDPGEPERAVGKLARKHRVKARPAGTYKAMPVVKAAVRDHSAEAGRLCLEGVLSEAEAGGAAARSAAQAWARGDVREAIAGPRNFQRCIRSLPGMVELEKRAMDDEIAALTEAMKTPGHAVALFSIRGLVAQNGLLDRMRAKGFTVKTPGD
ncbi:MAG: TraB/GumN family protein [Caulobacter sp. 35-67-4]|nr:MAG: TraB/GumN family protein [Caulobacter sp. 35-67-4]